MKGVCVGVQARFVVGVPRNDTPEATAAVDFAPAVANLKQLLANGQAAFAHQFNHLDVEVWPQASPCDQLLVFNYMIFSMSDRILSMSLPKKMPQKTTFVETK